MVLFFIVIFPISVFLFLLICGCLDFSRNKLEKQNQPECEITSWSETHKHSLRIYAPYPNNKVLNNAKRIVDRICPFQYRPHGGTFMVVLQRQFYLNKYLWFYNSHGRFPRLEKLLDKPPQGYGLPYEHKPILEGSWYVPTRLSKEIKEDEVDQL